MQGIKKEKRDKRKKKKSTKHYKTPMYPSIPPIPKQYNMRRRAPISFFSFPFPFQKKFFPPISQYVSVNNGHNHLDNKLLHPPGPSPPLPFQCLCQLHLHFLIHFPGLLPSPHSDCCNSHLHHCSESRSLLSNSPIRVNPHALNHLQVCLVAICCKNW